MDPVTLVQGWEDMIDDGAGDSLIFDRLDAVTTAEDAFDLYMELFF
jgi:hypothetical protein